MSPGVKAEIETVLSGITSAVQLAPLNENETLEILDGIRSYHGQAYGWSPGLDAAQAFAIAEKHGYLLRTRIRAVVETLDQLYQYGEAGKMRINELGQATFDEGDEEETSLASFL